MIHDYPVRHDIHTYIHVYIYRHQHNHYYNIITRYHKVKVKIIPFIYSQHGQHWEQRFPTYPRHLAPQVHLIYLSYFLSHDYSSIVHLSQWTQPTQPIVILLPSVSLIHASASSESYIACWTQFSSPQAPVNFLFPKPIPKTQNIKDKTRNKQE